MKKISLFLILSLMGTLFISCTKEETVDEKFKNAIPKSHMLNLDVPEATKKALNELSKSYVDTVQFTRDVNTAVYGWLSMVDSILQYPPTSFSDTVATWGPWLPDGGLSSVEYRFVVTSNVDESFDYNFEIKPKGSVDASFVPIYSGHVDSQSNLTQNSGSLFFDFTTAASIDLSVSESGSLDIDYSYLEGQKDIQVHYNEFMGDNMTDPINANYHYHSAATLEGYFDFEYWADMHQNTEDATLYPNDEHLQLRSRWTANGDGRSDTVVTGADLDSLNFVDFKVSECWSESFMSLFKEESIETTDGTLIENILWGDATGCTSFPTFESPDLSTFLK
jgi:hypothetical protein